MNKIPFIIILLIIFLVPIFFWPLSGVSAFHEFAKQFLFYFLVLFGLAFHILRALIHKDIEFRRTPLDIPVIIFWLVYVVSMVFSVDRITSLFGTYGQFNSGLISMTAYVIFYFLLTNNLTSKKRKKMALNVFLVSAGLVAWFSLFQFLGVRIFPFDFAKVSSFNLVSQNLSSLGLFLASIIILSLGLLQRPRPGSNSPRAKNLSLYSALLIIVLILSFAVLVALNFKNVWLCLAISSAVLFVWALFHRGQKLWLSVSLVVLIVSSLLYFFSPPSFLRAKLPVEVSLSRDLSWQIAWHSFKDHWLLGSGPDTFVYDFSKYRPASFNDNFAWQTRFNRASSGLIELLATTGLLGVLAFCFLLFRAVLSSLKSRFIVFFLAVLIGLFFFAWTTISWFLLWLGFGLLMTARLKPKFISIKDTSQGSLVVSFALVVFLVLCLISGVMLVRVFLAENAFQRGDFQTAITNNPLQPQYWLTSGQSFLQRANDEQDQERKTALIAAGINQANKASLLSPNNVFLWQARAQIYKRVGSSEWTKKSYQKAIELEPSNALFWFEIGRIDFNQGLIDQAIDNLERAVQLKNNYSNALYLLALTYDKRQDRQKAIEIMKEVLRLNPDNEEIKQRLNNWQ